MDAKINTENHTIDGLQLIENGRDNDDTLFKMIENSRMFNDFDKSDIESLLQFTHAYNAEKGTQLFQEGEYSGFMCLIIDGCIDVYKGVGTDYKKIARIYRGKTMGEMSLIDGLPYSATSVTAENTTLVIITRESFARLADQNPKVAFKVLQKITKLISLRLRQTTQLLLDHM